MKKLSFFAAAMLLISLCSKATIRRVGFFSTPVTGVDYASLQAAHDAAASGDTIMMLPGASMSATFSKTLIVIGPGWFLDPSNTTIPGNAGLQVNPNSTANGTITFNTGSSNSQIIGCQFVPSFSAGSTSGILFKRCWINGGVAFNTSGTTTNVTFQQCEISSYIYTYGTGAITNLSFLNCLIENPINLTWSSSPSTSGLISNCVFSSSINQVLGSGAWQIQNSISQSSFSGTNILYNNNVGSGTQFPTGNGNQQNKAWNTIFNLTGSYDGKYALKAGSPAIGAGIIGTTATDCGIFGGTTPYHLSGIPSVPTIYALTSPQGTVPAGNSVQINLSTRSNN